MDTIFYWIGVVVSAMAVLALAALLLDLSTQYAWDKMKAAYGLARLHRAIRSMADDDAEARG